MKSLSSRGQFRLDITKFRTRDGRFRQGIVEIGYGIGVSRSEEDHKFVTGRGRSRSAWIVNPAAGFCNLKQPEEMYDDRDPFPKKTYRKSTIIIWLLTIVLISAGVKLLFYFLR